jgi:hypothetical protein
MPDFDTRRPQEEGPGDAAARAPVASIATRVRTLLMANKLRAVLASGVLLVVAAVVPLWLVTHPSSEASDDPVDRPHSVTTHPSSGASDDPVDRPHSVTCDGPTWWEKAECVPPTSKPGRYYGIFVCRAPSRAWVNRTGDCEDQEVIGTVTGGD